MERPCGVRQAWVQSLALVGKLVTSSKPIYLSIMWGRVIVRNEITQADDLAPCLASGKSPQTAFIIMT